MGPIYVKNTEKYGRGIFASRNIEKGELIEQSPVLVSPKSERKYLKKTTLFQYCFIWGEKYDQTAIALGYGSLFNHSFTPNAMFINDLEHLTINFYAISDIQEGDEIKINYNGDPNDRTPLWFEVLD
ncbi:SET domain-containing protein-lysine N-methyltransferase [Bacillus sp. BRMEA1]|uniref:SET domain-containing protein n=1 Tax=Neobacillus endophyticus TaxID=2738405 RepID=UPI0015639DED|nr:SET domain-containing protein [Neobacillus endophyticus]NRD76716.1 SET domain-containing protein-lysine N-methyltransferase [Neobacillus endophyticus]